MLHYLEHQLKCVDILQIDCDYDHDGVYNDDGAILLITHQHPLNEYVHDYGRRINQLY